MRANVPLTTISPATWLCAGQLVLNEEELRKTIFTAYQRNCIASYFGFSPDQDECGYSQRPERKTGKSKSNLMLVRTRTNGQRWKTLGEKIQN